MTQTAIKLTARVLSGHRVEFTAPELIEGEEVELIVLKSNRADPSSKDEPQGVWDFIQSLKPIQRTPEEWAEIEREFREDRNSWDS